MRAYGPDDDCPHGQCGGRLVCARCGEFPNCHSAVALALEHLARSRAAPSPRLRSGAREQIIGIPEYR